MSTRAQEENRIGSRSSGETRERRESILRVPSSAAYEDRFPDLHSLGIVLNRTFLNILTFSIVIPTSEAYASALGMSRVFSGITIGLLPIASVAVQPVSNRWITNLGFRTTILLGLIIAIVGCLLYCFALVANSSAMLLISRFVQGLGATNTMVGVYVLRAVGPKRRTDIMQLTSALQALGYAGPAIGFLLLLIPAQVLQDEIISPVTIPGWFLIVLNLISMTWVLLRFTEPPLLSSHQSETLPLSSSTSSSPPSTIECTENDEETSRGEVKRSKCAQMASWPWLGLISLMMSSISGPFLFGSMEVFTVQVVATRLFGLNQEFAALYLGILMLLGATVSWLTARIRYVKRGPDTQVIVVFHAIGAVTSFLLMLPLKDQGSLGIHSEKSTIPVVSMLLYSLLAIASMVTQTIARGAAFSAVSKLPPHKYKTDVVTANMMVYMGGRGLGAIFGSFIDDPAVFATVLAGWNFLAIHIAEKRA